MRIVVICNEILNLKLASLVNKHICDHKMFLIMHVDINRDCCKRSSCSYRNFKSIQMSNDCFLSNKLGQYRIANYQLKSNDEIGHMQ